jgi:hypothetical protein
MDALVGGMLKMDTNYATVSTLNTIASQVQQSADESKAGKSANETSHETNAFTLKTYVENTSVSLLSQHTTKYSTNADSQSATETLDTIQNIELNSPEDFKRLKVLNENKGPMRFHVESFARRMGDQKHFENLERIFSEFGILRDDETSCDKDNVIRAENLIGFRVPSYCNKYQHYLHLKNNELLNITRCVFDINELSKENFKNGGHFLKWVPSAGGRHVTYCHTLGDAHAMLTTQQTPTMKYVFCEAVPNPRCVHGKKADLRVFAYIAQNGEAYIYTDCGVRISEHMLSVENPESQKTNAYKMIGSDEWPWVDMSWERTRETLVAPLVKEYIKQSAEYYRTSMPQILTLDVMITTELKAFFIECNAGRGIFLPCIPLEKQVIRDILSFAQQTEDHGGFLPLGICIT